VKWLALACTAREQPSRDWNQGLPDSRSHVLKSSLLEKCNIALWLVAEVSLLRQLF
jgi:hypothetical protein